MAEATAYGTGWLEGLTPAEPLAVSDWADRYRRLSQRASAEPGDWRTARTPYLREIQDNLSKHSPVEITVLRKGSQVGGTEVGNNFLGYCIDHNPGPFLYVMPTDTMAKRTSKQRIAPMIAESPALVGKVRDSRSRDSGNTMLAKEFNGGILLITGANSATGLRSMPARDLYADEVDAWPMDVDGEGDPLELALARTRTYRRNRKVLLTSTPTVRGQSRIDNWHELGDCRVYVVACPSCGVYQPITWDRITWDKDDDGNHLPETAHLVCSDCEHRIEEHQKTELLAAGYWQPTVDKPVDPRVRSYSLSALYSPLGWYGWADAVRDFLKAKRQGREALKAWTNTVLGESWEEDAEEVDPSILIQRREKYEAPVPDGAVLLTAGVDIQADRIELEVVAWSPDAESWGVDYRILWGDTNQGEVWEELDAALSETWQHENGATLGIYAACIDAGFLTSQVYEFCRTRQGRRIFAVMGKDGPGRPMVSAPQQKRTGQRRRPVRLFTLGVDAIKALVYSRFKLTEPGPGYCHFPLGCGYNEETFHQLTAEKVTTRYRRGVAFLAWVKKRARNEALDCRTYAHAAVIITDPAWKALRRRLEKMATGKPEGDDQPRRRRRRRQSYATSWRK